jgi:glycosyltransferase involved in cell wall biosynthesis
MKETSPATLVIVPTYNRAAFLPEAVESVLSQNDANPSILIVDDGSHDETQRLCENYSTRYPDRFYYLYQENQGCSSARNRGLDWLDSRFYYVCFLDSDDRLLPGKLRRETDLLACHPDKAFTYADSIIFDEQSNKAVLKTVAAAGKPDHFAIEHFLTNEAKCSAILYRAAAIGHRRFREDLKYNEDSEFLQRIALEYRGIYAPEPGCWVRWHAGSKSRNFIEIQKAVLRASQDILKAYPEFHASFRRRADLRIRGIRQSLFRQLMLFEDWDEAKLYAETPIEKLFVALRSNQYYKMRRQAGKALMRMSQVTGDTLK